MTAFCFMPLRSRLFEIAFFLARLGLMRFYASRIFPRNLELEHAALI
jgi:hypothetical protein